MEGKIYQARLIRKLVKILVGGHLFFLFFFGGHLLKLAVNCFGSLRAWDWNGQAGTIPFKDQM